MMPVLASLAFIQVQDPSTASAGDVHLLMIFVGVIAAFCVLSLIGLAIAGIYAAKLMARVDKFITTMEKNTTPLLEKARPIIDKTSVLIEGLIPKIKSVTDNVEHISGTARAKVDEIGQTVSEINRTVQDVNGRTRAQVAHVDGIVSSALTTTSEISDNVQQGIRAPFRHMAGIFTGLKVGLDTLIERSGFRNRSAAPRPRGSSVSPVRPVAIPPDRPSSSPVGGTTTSTPGRPYDV